MLVSGRHHAKQNDGGHSHGGHGHSHIPDLQVMKRSHSDEDHRHHHDHHDPVVVFKTGESFDNHAMSRDSSPHGQRTSATVVTTPQDENVFHPDTLNHSVSSPDPVWRQGIPSESSLANIVPENVCTSPNSDIELDGRTIQKAHEKAHRGNGSVNCSGGVWNFTKALAHECVPKKTLGWMVIMGDGVHNLIDGIALGAAFSEDLVSGLSTSIAIACHEIPHEVGDFAALLTAGLTWRAALIWNVIHTLLAFGIQIKASI